MPPLAPPKGNPDDRIFFSPLAKLWNCGICKQQYSNPKEYCTKALIEYAMQSM